MEKNIAKALVAAQAEFPNLKKDTEGYGYSYADIGQLISTVRPLLKKHKMCFDHTVYEQQMVCTLTHETGEKIESRCPLVGDLEDMQKLGSALTYARRYTLLAILGLAAEDDDGVKATQTPSQGGGRTERGTMTPAPRSKSTKSLPNHAPGANSRQG